MSAQAEQMQAVVADLMALVGAKRESAPPKGSRRASRESTKNGGPAKREAPAPRPAKTSEQVIPFEDPEDLNDF